MIRIEGIEGLQLSFGNAFRVIRIEVKGGNDYLLLDAVARLWLRVEGSLLFRVIIQMIYSDEWIWTPQI